MSSTAVKRRSDYIGLTNAQIIEAAALAGKGLPQAQIAARIGVERRTYQRRLKDQPGVAVAIEKGVAAANLKVLDKTLEMIMTGKFPVLNIFWLKAKCGFALPAEDVGENPRWEDESTLRL